VSRTSHSWSTIAAWIPSSQAIPSSRSARTIRSALSNALPILSSVDPRTPKYASAATAITPISRATPRADTG
jgi:hypothetical protein